MDWSLAQTYYLVASITGLVATCINVVLFVRSRPDRLKAKVSEAIAPFERRLADLEKGQVELESAQVEASRRHDVSVRSLDQDVNGRLERMSAKADAQHRETNNALAEQSRALERIAARLEHGVTRRDIDTLHHRVTEAAKGVASCNGVVDGLAKMVHNIEDFLREGGRG